MIINNVINKIKTGNNTIIRYVDKSSVNYENLYNIYKNMCIDSLKNMIERTFVLEKKSGVCIGEFLGNEQSCYINRLPKDKSLLILHGHVPLKGTNISLPVSLQDFELMNNSHVDKIIAYDINGMQSSLEKGKGFTSLGSNEILLLKCEYLEKILLSMDETEQMKVKKLLSYCNENKNSVAVKKEIADIFNKAQYTEKAAKSIDEFWHTNADKYNLIYKPYNTGKFN